jgi:hypothetical protein
VSSINDRELNAIPGKLAINQAGKAAIERENLGSALRFPSSPR